MFSKSFSERSLDLTISSFAASILFNNSFSPGLPDEPGLLPSCPSFGSPVLPFFLPPGFLEGFGVPFFPSLPSPADEGFPGNPKRE